MVLSRRELDKPVGVDGKVKGTQRPQGFRGSDVAGIESVVLETVMYSTKESKRR